MMPGKIQPPLKSVLAIAPRPPSEYTQDRQTAGMAVKLVVLWVAPVNAEVSLARDYASASWKTGKLQIEIKFSNREINTSSLYTGNFAPRFKPMNSFLIQQPVR